MKQMCMAVCYGMRCVCVYAGDPFYPNFYGKHVA